MSERPTPDTDAAEYLISIGRKNDEWVVRSDFARKLERERDEARKIASELAIQAERLRKGRDEAREALKHIEEYGTEEINASVELRQKLAQTLIERDEARERERVAITSWDEERQRALREGERILEARRERDEAREQVKELIYIAGRAIELAEIDYENDKFGVVSELRNDLEKIKESK